MKKKQLQPQKKPGPFSEDEISKLEKLYTDGPAAYGSIRNLQKYSKLPREKVLRFLESQHAYTKYRMYRRKFPRLKVIAYRINEIWSVDLAYVNQVAKYNNDVKYLLIAVDVLSRYLRVEPMKNKGSIETAKAFTRMIKVKKPEKVWSDKGTEFKADFKRLCERRGIETYTTESETKSAFAERNIQSLKSIITKYLEKNWTYKYIDKLQSFVKTINSRVNRVTKLAPNKVTKNDVPHLLSLTAEKSKQLFRNPKLTVGDYVRIAKKDLPFKKGYRQNFTDEVFTITNIPTTYPPTYNLADAKGELILGKFYEPELIRLQLLRDDNGDE